MEASAVLLGHAGARVTDAVYAERDQTKVAEIMRLVEQGRANRIYCQIGHILFAFSHRAVCQESADSLRTCTSGDARGVLYLRGSLRDVSATRDTSTRDRKETR